jgi:hypothetical protein
MVCRRLEHGIAFRTQEESYFYLSGATVRRASEWISMGFKLRLDLSRSITQRTSIVAFELWTTIKRVAGVKSSGLVCSEQFRLLTPPRN